MGAFAGTPVLVRLILRRDRVWLPVWMVSIVGLVHASVATVIGFYDDPASIEAYRTAVGSSAATVAMNGPPAALGTIGGIVVYETVLVALLGIAFMAIFTTVRHTRGDEEAGRTELLGSTRLGRQAPILAAAIVAMTSSALTGAGISLSFLVSGLPAAGSILFGAAMACIGLVFTAVALVAAQVNQHARGATGMTLGLFGAFYVVRAVGDVTHTWIWALSPLGWSQHVLAFERNLWWPLLLSLGATALLTGVAGWLTTRRDLGAGLVQPRLGRRQASPRLASPFGLALRTQRGVLIGWLVAMVAMGAVYGSLVKEVEDMTAANPDLAELLRKMAGGTMTEIYLGVIISVSAMVATGFTIQSVLRMRADEDRLLLEQMLATPLTRLRWSLGGLALTAGGTVALLGTFGAATGLAVLAFSSGASPAPVILWASLAYVPACLVMGAAVFALFGWWPRAAAAGWALLAVVFVVGWMGSILELPQWLIDLTPYNVTPQLPVETLRPAPLLALGALAAGLWLLGLVGLRHRDVGRT